MTRILVVDDEIQIRRALDINLRQVQTPQQYGCGRSKVHISFIVPKD